MYWSRDNEPDLGDERFGRRSYEDDSVDYSYSPSISLNTKSLSIPLAYYTYSRGKLEQIFTDLWQDSLRERVKAERERKIQDLKLQLEKLESENENH